MIACSLEQHTAHIQYGRLPIGPPDVWCVDEEIESCREFYDVACGEEMRLLAAWHARRVVGPPLRAS